MTLGERVQIPVDGFTLEGLRWVPEGAVSAPGAVLCHPHPLRGGNMKNNVVAAVWEALAPLGFALLRFNFRGVGRSGGEHDEGVGEQRDVSAALSFLASTPGVDPGSLCVVGYSFGAWTCGRAALSEPAVRAVALIAPPLGIFSLDEVRAETRPKLAVVGDRDEYCPLPAFRGWYEGLPAPKDAYVIAGADHFFGGREEEAAGATARFLERAVGHGGPSSPQSPTGEERIRIR